MRHTNWLFDRLAFGKAITGCLILLGLTVTGCGSSGPAETSDADNGLPPGAVPVSNLGSIFVSVTDQLGLAVADAAVSTQPATSLKTTDALGSVLLNDVPAGTYAVTATHATAGAARVPLVVVAGAIAHANLMLRPTATSAGAPQVAITAPVDGSTVRAGTLVALHGQVTGSLDANLTFDWRSSIDGSLGHGLVSAGLATANAVLSAGVHLLTLTVTDSAGRAGSSAITVAATGNTDGGSTDLPAAGDGGPTDANTPSVLVSLNAPTKDSNGINLSWTATPAADVASYRVYRSGGNSGFTVVGVIPDPTTTTFRDDQASLGVMYTYRVDALLNGGGLAQSNVQMITAGVFIAVDTEVTEMRVDRTRPYLYAIDTVNNSLLFVNVTTNKVDKTIFIGSRPNDMDINQAGTELYVANFGATEIAVVNLDMQEKVRALAVDTHLSVWDGNPYRLACTAGDTVVFTSMDQWNDLKMVNAQTGANLNVAGEVYEPDLVANSDGTRIFVTGGAADGLERYDVSANMLTATDNSGEFGGGSGTITISGDDKFLFVGNKKYLATNLKSMLGTFSESILIANQDGSVVIGAGSIHDGNTFAVTRMLPLSTSIMAMSPDEATLYLYDSMTSRIFLYKLK